MHILKTLKELTGKDYIPVGTDEQAVILKKPVDWTEGDFCVTDKGFVGKVFSKEWKEIGQVLNLEKGKFTKGKFIPNVKFPLVQIHVNNCNLVSQKEAEQLLIKRCKSK